MSNDQQLFHSIDTDNSGMISKQELRAALRKARLPTSSQHFEKLFQKIDTNSDGGISQEEFAGFLKRREAVLRETFGQITSGEPKGKFTGSMLRQYAKRTGVTLADSDVRHIMSKLDENCDGVVSFEEFRDGLLLAPTSIQRRSSTHGL